MLSPPDDIWRRILKIGVTTSNLSYRDLCCLSISCRRLHRLSNEDSLWYLLLASDFPTAVPDSSLGRPSKSAYKIRFESKRRLKFSAHRRELLRTESRIAVHSRRLQVLKRQARQDSEKFEAAAVELRNLRKARQASVALNVWQPEVIRSRQKQLVEQSVVPIECRMNSLEMELKLCTQQISASDTAMKMETNRLAVAKKQLASLNYHPFHDKGSMNSHASVPNPKRIKCINDSKIRLWQGFCQEH